MLFTTSWKLALDVEISTKSSAYIYIVVAVCYVAFVMSCVTMLNRNWLMGSPCKTPFVCLILYEMAK